MFKYSVNLSKVAELLLRRKENSLSISITDYLGIEKIPHFS